MNEKNKKLINSLDKTLPSSFLDRCNVLLIDDEVQNLNCFKALFRRKLNIFTAVNKIEALDIIKNNKIDFIFCDYKIPVYNGADILKEIVKIYPKIKRAILTGFSDIEIIQEFKRKSNTSDLIMKPYNENDILTRLGKLCSE